jgi:carbohydrate kinase (thermoresistant glucokinase family)
MPARGHPVVVIMGPSGSGKSTVGAIVARRLGVDFVDADDFHSAANVAAMAEGRPLDAAARRPWLDRLHDELVARRGSGVVLACSALAPSSRAILRAGTPDALFVHLAVRPTTLDTRLRARPDHFADERLLASQLDTLDLGDDTRSVDGEQPPPAVAAAVVRIVGGDDPAR